MSTSTDKSFLSIWPGIPVPLPERYTAGYLTHARLVEGAAPEERKSADLPPEFYLREVLDLDLDADAAIEVFAGTWGSLEGDEAQLIRVEEHAMGDLVRSVLTAAKEKQPHDAFRAWAHLLRDAVRMWLTLQGAMSLAELKGAWEGDSRLMPKSIKAATGGLSLALNVALAPFQMHATASSGETAFPSTPSLFSVASLQLANDINDGVTYQRCQNEKCNRLFARQRGRSQGERDRRKGLLFCSHQCATATAQRTYRRVQRLRQQVLQLSHAGSSPEEIASRFDLDAGLVRVWIVAEPLLKESRSI